MKKVFLVLALLFIGFATTPVFAEGEETEEKSEQVATEEEEDEIEWVWVRKYDPRTKTHYYEIVPK